jgi:double-stranded uracil-DNA glycosylase
MEELPLLRGLPPLIGGSPRILILGSFPSERSLQAHEYYANRRNQFWALLGAVFDFDAAAPYPQRVEAAQHNGIALWDVVHSCRRAGSLDAKIDRASVVVNDFGRLRGDHPGIGQIFVNGLTALELFERHVEIGLPATRLPSSSPAATMPFEDKLARWRELA